MGHSALPAVDGRVLLQLDQPGRPEERQHKAHPGGAWAVSVHRAARKGGHCVAQPQPHRQLSEEERVLLRRRGQQRDAGRRHQQHQRGRAGECTVV